MAQHRIVNLDKKQVLDPKLVGTSRTWGYFSFTESPVMGGLLLLLVGEWSGDRVAIVSNRAADFDLPIAEEVCGIPASELCFPALHGHERFKNVAKKVRENLASDYGYRFRLRNTTTTTISDSGAEETTTSSSVQSLGSTARILTESIQDGVDFMVINHDKGQFIRSRAFSPCPSLRAAIINTWSEEGEHSWLPTALAVLLTTSLRYSRFFIEDYSGTWAGDRISVEYDGAADLDGLEDVSVALKDAMVNTDVINFRLEADPGDDEDEEGLGEED